VSLPYEISPQDVKAKTDAGEAVALIDVREAFEHQLSSIGGAELIPMNNVPQRLQHLESLADDKLLIVFCHHGMRSMSVVNWLRQQGVDNCQSMSGGIDLWSLTVDQKVKRY